MYVFVARLVRVYYYKNTFSACDVICIFRLDRMCASIRVVQMVVQRARVGPRNATTDIYQKTKGYDRF